MTERRPLTARSVIASTLLGVETLGVETPRLPTLALVRSGELFGLREGTTRTALSRMAAAGEITTDGGHCALTGRLLDRHVRQRTARRVDPVDAWDGSWTLAMVHPARRSAAARTAFRDGARTLHLAEVREGLWARPGSIDARLRPEAYAVVSDQADWIRDARPEDTAPFLDAFDLDAWARDARRLVDEMAETQPALDARDTTSIGVTFVTAAAVLRHLVADPRLPPALLPVAWPGQSLRVAFDRFDTAFKATWSAWYREFRTDDDRQT